MLWRFGAVGRASLPGGTNVSREFPVLLHPLLLQAFVCPGNGFAKKVIRV